MNLTEIFEEITEKADDDKALEIIYMDFSKTFNKVPYDWLL